LQQAVAVGSFDAPDRIQRLLELGHDADGSEQQRADTENRRQRTLVWMVRRRQQRFQGFRSGTAEQACDLRRDLAMGRVGSEHQAGNGGADDEERPEGEDRIIGQRGAHH
jgi:hypothetical protein